MEVTKIDKTSMVDTTSRWMNGKVQSSIEDRCGQGADIKKCTLAPNVSKRIWHYT